MGCYLPSSEDRTDIPHTDKTDSNVDTTITFKELKAGLKCHLETERN